MSLKANIIAGLAASVAAALAGCSADDVQLNGKVFDVMGMNTASVKKTPKMNDRPGLLVPPDMARLPEPGTANADQPEIAEVKDYDATRQTTEADLEKQQAAYCQKHYEDAKMHGDQDAVLASGPLGPCQKSVMSIMKNVSGDSE